MKKIVLTFAIFVAALFAVVASACKTDGKQDGAGYSVMLDKQSVSLIVFDRCELTAMVWDAQSNAAQRDVSWRSADESVAKVADGIIFATGAGATEVSAILDNGASAKCVVTVTDNGVIPELRVNTKSLSVYKGRSFTVIPRVFFNGGDCTESDTEFAYTSAQDGIATVSQDGIITATAAGNTKITVYALWRGIGGPERKGDENAIAALSLTIDVKVIDI